jgi:hypothetical protein
MIVPGSFFRPVLVIVRRMEAKIGSKIRRRRQENNKRLKNYGKLDEAKYAQPGVRTGGEFNR